MSGVLQDYKNQQDFVLAQVSKSDTAARNRIKTNINLGYQDFVLRELWPFREVVGSLSTVNGTQSYSLASNFSDLDAQNIVSVTLQGTNTKLVYWPYAQLRANQPDFTNAGASTPQRYTIEAGNIIFWPTPDDVYTVYIEYHKVPTEMSADSDEPIIPLAYREALAQYALSLENTYDGNPDLAAAAQNRFEQIVTLARNNLLSQPYDSGAFTVLGPNDSRSHTGLKEEIV